MNECYCLKENERPIKCGDKCPRVFGLENMLNNREIIDNMDEEDIEKAQIEFLKQLVPCHHQYWV